MPVPGSDDYDTATSGLETFGQRLQTLIEDLLETRSLSVNQVTHRVKSRESALSKVRDHPEKYSAVTDLTDLLGIRVITFFPRQVDAVAEMITDEFDVDYSRSVDKRAELDPDQFGYLSLHYLAKLNDGRAALAEYSQFGSLYVEFQIRSLLQHTWAEIEHDLGYKSQIAIPREIRRRFSRLAGVLELADTEFQAIYDERTDYSARVSASISVSPGNLLLDQVSLVGYIEQSETVQQLDQKMALILRSHLGPEPDVSVSYADMIATAILPLGIETIEQLDGDLVARAESIVAFATQWAALGTARQEPVPAEIPRGISLFYLAIILAVEIYDDDPGLENWTTNSLNYDAAIADDFREVYTRSEL